MDKLDPEKWSGGGKSRSVPVIYILTGGPASLIAEESVRI